MPDAARDLTGADKVTANREFRRPAVATGYARCGSIMRPDVTLHIVELAEENAGFAVHMGGMGQ